MIDVLVQPPDEIGWRSEFTHSAWGPTYRVLDCHVCNRSGRRWEPTDLALELVLVRCAECGGQGAYAELVGPPPPWIFE